MVQHPIRAGELNGSIKPAVPWLEFYSAQSATADVAPLWNNLMWEYNKYDYLVIRTSDFDYNEDNITGTILVYTTGLYSIDLDLGFTNPLESHTVTTRMLLNGVEIVASRGSVTATLHNNQADMQIYTTKIVYLKAGDKLTFQYQSDSDSTSFTSDNHGRIRIQFIPMGGWNNNSGGNVVYRGVRR